jgi:hypothetical protein
MSTERDDLVSKLIDIREQELAENAVTKLTKNNIEVDTRLISKEVIFTGKTNTNLFLMPSQVPAVHWLLIMCCRIQIIFW